MSEESRKKMSEAKKGKSLSDDHKRKMSEAHKGKKFTKEHRENISKALMGHEVTEETREKHRQANLGKTFSHTEETKKKMSKSKMGHPVSEETRKKLSDYNKKQGSWVVYGHPMDNPELRAKIQGPNHHNWKGGIGRLPYPYEFTKIKSYIRERDNFTCQVCGLSGNTVHHIDYNKENCEEKNLINTCKSCNGKANFNREHWQLKFSLIQALRGV